MSLLFEGVIRDNKTVTYSNFAQGVTEAKDNHGFSVMEFEIEILILAHCYLSQFFGCKYF